MRMYGRSSNSTGHIIDSQVSSLFSFLTFPVKTPLKHDPTSQPDNMNLAVQQPGERDPKRTLTGHQVGKVRNTWVMGRILISLYICYFTRRADLQGQAWRRREVRGLPEIRPLSFL